MSSRLSEEQRGTQRANESTRGKCDSASPRRAPGEHLRPIDPGLNLRTRVAENVPASSVLPLHRFSGRASIIVVAPPSFSSVRPPFLPASPGPSRPSERGRAKCRRRRKSGVANRVWLPGCGRDRAAVRHRRSWSPDRERAAFDQASCSSPLTPGTLWWCLDASLFASSCITSR